MKEFRIGQRVRIINATRHPDLLGRVGTITSGIVEYVPGKPVQDVQVDGVPSPGGHGWCGPPHSMEPIDEDKGDWSVIQHVTGWIPREKVT